MSSAEEVVYSSFLVSAVLYLSCFVFILLVLLIMYILCDSFNEFSFVYHKDNRISACMWTWLLTYERGCFKWDTLICVCVSNIIYKYYAMKK